MNLFHLSHTDLDGYSAQLISSYYFENTFYYNSNYGTEVTVKLNKIEQDLQNFSSKDETLLLITDLNITHDECELAQKIVSRLNFFGKNVRLQLLDHHASGEAQAKNFKWYFLDTKRCATKITQDFLKKNYKPVKQLPELLNAYVSAVNAYDIWEVDNALFEFGKVLNRAALDSKEVPANMFQTEHFSYKKYMLEASFAYIKDNAFIDYDDDLLKIKKAFLAQNGERSTLDNLVSAFLLSLLDKNKENMTVSIMNKKGILTSAIGNTSVLGNAFLLKNQDYDFFIDVGYTGNISMRANGKVDVSQMAAKLFNGGGHPNAAGGRVTGLKETFIYENVKHQVQERFGA
ncbi:MAG: DHH family phosphoesterase [Helicobacteraceae bacterium]